MCAGKAKSDYLTVMDRKTYKTVFSKVFFKMADLNEYIKTDEFKAKYPTEHYEITKETY